MKVNKAILAVRVYVCGGDDYFGSVDELPCNSEQQVKISVNILC